ncbi:MAG: septal ring lytic transglycosylase RlpA family protein [Acidovorax sp.]|uniref:septal ring lytic transglycosylase RlpA family protein n=1 Tax=Acidovorax sp. TaxID=1872122 RepID=UPI0025BB75ED|nr:septal ring lytic transglycosylase RlpA family protein [Acidovorax sp.]MCE1194278.1 septal ring lytic transglycosylase RlpA family protein [Acidovorax sp.]
MRQRAWRQRVPGRLVRLLRLAAACLVGLAPAGLLPAHAQGLSAEADALAPHLLSVPGEAMLIDPPAPPGPRPGETGLSVAPEVGLSADEVGLASWYGAKFHKRRTASGELFDMKALTAAHPTLPFGSRVCVRSQATGRTVIVRINDRGPHSANRIIDLSRGAAEALGMVGLGLKPVELFALDDGESDCPAAP